MALKPADRSSIMRTPIEPGGAIAAIRGFRIERSAIAISSAAAIPIALLLRFVFAQPFAADAVLLTVLAAGGLPVLISLIREMLAGRFASDLLAGVAIATAVAVHEYLVGVIILLMISGGAALESYATDRASSALAALVRRMPRIAHRKTVEAIEDIALELVRPGDELVVYPHETCPADGDVIEGSSSMDEAYLTGEPYVIPKTRGNQVYSGALNGESALVIRATAVAADSRYAQIVKILRQAEQDRPEMRRLADRLGAWYTPAALLTAIAAWLATGQSSRFLAVIVIATPCPLLLAVPVALMGAISLAARRSIVIKNASLLEQID